MALTEIDPTVITQYVQVSKSNLRAQFDNIKANFDTLDALVVSGTASKWYAGTGAPSVATGEDGDFYLNNSNGDVYKKASGTWTLQTNITGPAGAGNVDSVNGQTGTVVLNATDVGATPVTITLPDASQVTPLDTMVIGDGLAASNDGGNQITLSTDALVVQENGTQKVSRTGVLNFTAGATITDDGSGGADIDITAAATPIVRVSGAATTDRPGTVEIESPLSLDITSGVATLGLGSVSPQTTGTIIKAEALADLGGVTLWVRPGYYRWNGTTWDYMNDLMFEMPRTSYTSYTLTQADFRYWFYFWDVAASPVLQTLNIDPTTLLSGDGAVGSSPTGYNYEEVYIILENKAGLKISCPGAAFRVPGTSTYDTPDSITIATTDSARTKSFAIRFVNGTTPIFWILGQS